ncbi:D,D-heptose 1,7-bisphosphate phosphatase [Hoylesella shahii DSM 15611 = JCM 12083]|uniref:D,D-heptose 1,7-bisphosphate phosphatase n=2 Tax=Hoylesella shahii TaxID=228603 RepID=A0A318HQV3_9BACT|nr:HAD-IIIA family hydrolase [Hoylesella shahii]PXX20865.1 D,D-heptose 1,7-bisphosphate phosphatase [Hoylesella shahii DSM 15611 = JCM 12083]
MAGGKGTRIAAVRSDLPKPMIPVCGKPILEWQIENLKASGLTDIVLVIGHLGEVIKDYFGDGSRWGVTISYFIETQPLGTAGALFRMPELQEDFLLMSGDVMLDVDFNRFINFHKDHEALASLTVHPNNHPFDSSLIVTEILPASNGGMPIHTNRVVKWMNKEDERLYYRNVVNAGIEMISPRLLEEARAKLPSLDKVDLDRDVLKPAIESGKIYAYETSEYIKDMGTPERLVEVENDLLSGKIAAHNLSVKQKAVFLDRDGTINKTNGFLTDINDFELIEGAAEAIKQINKSGYLAVVVTNQPVIARGDCSFEQLQEIHNKMETLLGKEGAFIDGLFLCPHHTDKGFDGERIEYKLDCECRKPKAGLFVQAQKASNIDLAQSYMVGDSAIDIKAAENAGCKKAFLIETNGENALLGVVNEIFK